MKKAAVVYWSGTGNTEAMALKVSEVITSGGGEAQVFTALSFDPSQLGDFDGIAFGCPSMGSEELEEGEFAPMFAGCLPGLKGKRIALFGSYGWGDGEWMRNWEAACADAGAILPRESVICCGAPDEAAEAACLALGRALL